VDETHVNKGFGGILRQQKTIIRKEKNKLNPYAQVSRRSIQDPALSWKAKGLLAYLLSLPDDWQIYIKELPNHSNDGIKATRAAFNQLRATGYITGAKRRGEKGYFEGHEYVVHEHPVSALKAIPSKRRPPAPDLLTVFERQARDDEKYEELEELAIAKDIAKAKARGS